MLDLDGAIKRMETLTERTKQLEEKLFPDFRLLQKTSTNLCQFPTNNEIKESLLTKAKSTLGLLKKLKRNYAEMRNLMAVIQELSGDK